MNQLETLQAELDRFLGVARTIFESTQAKIQELETLQQQLKDERAVIEQEKRILGQERAAIEREKTMDKERKFILDRKEQELKNKAEKLQEIINSSQLQ